MSKDPKFNKNDKEEEIVDEKKGGGKYRGKGRRDKRMPRKSGPINDITYYTGKTPASQVVLEQTNTYSFTDFMGQPIDMGMAGGVAQTMEMSNIAQIALNPAAGFTSLAAPKSDGINIQAIKWYTYLSAKNGKTTNYAPEDVMLLILAVGNLLSMFSFGARGLGLMFTYNKRNRAFPEAAIEAAGFQYADLRDHLADYKIAYNILVNKFNKIPIPGDIAYFAKCSQMFQGIYLDEDGSSMAQCYCFVPESYWLLNEAYGVGGSALETQSFLPIPNARGLRCVPYSTYLSALESQIDVLLNSSTFNFIYADILRLAEGGMRVFTLNTIPYDYAIVPAKVDELSYWVNNLTVIGTPETTPETVGTMTFTNSNDVVANAANATVVYRPQFRTEIDWSGFDPLINFKYESPSIQDRVYATRLMSTLLQRPSADGSTWVSIEAALCDWYVTQICVSTGYSGTVTIDTSLLPSNYSSAQVMAACIELSKFDWSPYIYKPVTSGGTYSGVMKVYGDTQYFTTVNRPVLKRIQEICLMNQFDL